jgi:hypothetical protein
MQALFRIFSGFFPIFFGPGEKQSAAGQIRDGVPMEIRIPRNLAFA